MTKPERILDALDELLRKHDAMVCAQVDAACTRSSWGRRKAAEKQEEFETARDETVEKIINLFMEIPK